MTIIVPLGGLLADYVRRSGLLSTTNVRKLFNCGGFGLEAVFFIVVAYAKTAVSFMYHLFRFMLKIGFIVTRYISGDGYSCFDVRCCLQRICHIRI